MSLFYHQMGKYRLIMKTGPEKDITWYFSFDVVSTDYPLVNYIALEIQKINRNQLCLWPVSIATRFPFPDGHGLMIHDGTNPSGWALAELSHLGSTQPGEEAEMDALPHCREPGWHRRAPKVLEGPGRSCCCFEILEKSWKCQGKWCILTIL